jgi:hypothetical protein
MNKEYICLGLNEQEKRLLTIASLNPPCHVSLEFKVYYFHEKGIVRGGV